MSQFLYISIYGGRFHWDMKEETWIQLLWSWDGLKSHGSIRQCKVINGDINYDSLELVIDASALIMKGSYACGE